MVVVVVVFATTTTLAIDLDFIFNSVNFTAISVLFYYQLCVGPHKNECVSSCGAEIRLNYRI